MYCHSQQVRSEKFGNWWDETAQMRTGADIKRGWGLRRTVSRDYIYDARPCSARCGPAPTSPTSARRYSEAWQHTHTFNPRAVNDVEHHAVVRVPLYAGKRERRRAREGPEARPRVDRQPRLSLAAEREPSGTRSSREHGESIKAQFLAEPAGTSIDLNTPEGKQRLLDFWLTTEEEDYQIVPDRRRRGAGRVSARAAEGRGAAAGGQGMSTTTPPDPPQARPEPAPTRCCELHRQHMDEMNDAVMTVRRHRRPDEAAGATPSRGCSTSSGASSRAARRVRAGAVLGRGRLRRVAGWGGYYIGTNSADFRRDVFDRSDLRECTRWQQPAANVPDPDPQTVEELMKIGAAEVPGGVRRVPQAGRQGQPRAEHPAARRFRVGRGRQGIARPAVAHRALRSLRPDHGEGATRTPA